ncbi:MAG: AIR synthase, partial [Ardenticatenaceae bacterium]|nr:AIR synthase [Ardenticatenaceae bacterium]
MTTPLPLGKLPPPLLAQLLAQAPVFDERVIVKPGIGLDCAVIELGDTLLVFKSDPITFATDEIGWYLVQVNSNDIATTGATPRWLMVTMLLPEGQTTADLVTTINQQLVSACEEKGISLIGGHTEITYGLERPILMGTLIGEVTRDRLITPHKMNAGDHILLTKGIPIEATAILAREFPERLQGILSDEELQQAQNFLTEPGISVLREAQLAVDAGEVTAMHDPTEGGLAGALWELAEA